jgi:recombination protein RecA
MMTENTKQDKYLEFFKAYADADSAFTDVKKGTELFNQDLEVISTGSICLDDALGCGGLPTSRLIQFYGPPGSGKTLMAMIGVVKAQAKSKTAQQVWIDAEQTFDPIWASKIGIDLKRLIIVDGDMAVNGRRCFEMLLGVPKEDAKTHAYKGQAKNGLLDEIIAGDLDINFICLDSLGSLIPPGEDVSAVGKMNMALMARFLTTTLRKLSLQVSKTKLPFVLINHQKASMDPYGPSHTYSGGNSYSHFLSANIYFEPVNRADARILDEKERKIGQTIRGTIEKSKFGPWPRRCEFKVDFAIGIINQEEEIALLATDYGVLDHPTTVSYIYGDRKWVGMGKLLADIAADKDLANELCEKIILARKSKQLKERNEILGTSSEGITSDIEPEVQTKKANKKKSDKQQDKGE